jgi:hypothetical protein
VQILLDLVKGFLAIFRPFYLHILSQQLEQWFAGCIELCNEASYVVNPLQEASDLFFCSRRGHIPYSLSFCRINLDSPAADNEAQ